MDFLASALRNVVSVSNCISQKNVELLALLTPILIENFTLFSQMFANVEEPNARDTVSGILNIFKDQIRRCEDVLARFTEENNERSIQLPVLRLGQSGRPKIEIPISHVIALRHCDYSWTKIPQFLDIFRGTLWNARCQNHIEDPASSSFINDHDFSNAISEIKREHPSSGYRYVWSSLKSKGMYVPRSRLRHHLRTIDPIGTLNRRRQRLRRRRYKVKGANYLGHMDGNEKLVNWNLYIHGCVDGHSRKIVYLQLCFSKLAKTVLEFLTQGVAENGLPMRVRGDHGSENARVVDFMHSERQDILAPFIKGKSIYNTRIERMWGEVIRIVSSKYRNIFHHLENSDELSQLSLLDLLCLWYVYFPRIQKSLINFKNSWNHHSLSSEHNESPES